MIEIIVDGKTAREKLFDTYVNNADYRIVPKNDEIRKCCKFLKKYYNVYDENYLPNFFVMEINEENYKKTNYSCIDYDENFFFQFPDEKTAFYFKLKYC